MFSRATIWDLFWASFGALVPVYLFIAWMGGGAQATDMPIAMTTQFTLVASGGISALLWIASTRGQDGQASNFAAAGFAGAMAIFGITTATSLETIGAPIWIVEGQQYLGFFLGWIILLSTAVTLWKGRLASSRSFPTPLELAAAKRGAVTTALRGYPRRLRRIRR